MSVSAIYEGTVRHRRFAVRHHEFRHRLALLYLDLDELPGLLGGRLLAARPGPVRFRRRDYLGEDPSVPLAQALRNTVQAQTGARPVGPVRILTHPRTLGHCFNPVSFYYCIDPLHETVEAAVAEVTNTPWGERHAYVLGPAAGEPKSASENIATTAGVSATVLRGGLAKALHVSPFMGMDHRYEWRLTAPGPTLSVHVESRLGEHLAFDATLALQRRELTRSSLARVTARYPLPTLRVLALIYAHAARLKLTGVPVHPHPRVGAA